MLEGVVYGLSRPENLKTRLQQLGLHHKLYGVKDSHYPIVKSILMETIKDEMGKQSSESILNSWNKAIDFILEGMNS